MQTSQLPDFRLDTHALMQAYGYKSRTTLIKKEREGVIPKRRRFLDGQLGNMWSEFKAWADSAQVEDGENE